MALERVSDDQATAMQASLARHASALTPQERATDDEYQAGVTALALRIYDPADFQPDSPTITSATATPAEGPAPLTTVIDAMADPAEVAWTMSVPGRAPETTDPPWTVESLVTIGTRGIVIEADNAAGRDQVVVPVEVLPEPPILTVTVDGSGQAIAPFHATVRVANAGGAVDRWSFDPGDGGAIQTTSPPWAHEYPTPATYNLEVTADGAGGTDVEPFVLVVIP